LFSFTFAGCFSGFSGPPPPPPPPCLTSPIARRAHPLVLFWHRTCAARLKALQEKKDQSPNFYFLTLDHERIIDASDKGSAARFINHSCDANCETQKWSVNGQTRIGIFALKDIQPGEELTFDYQFENVTEVHQRCFCGAGNCRFGDAPPPVCVSGLLMFLVSLVGSGFIGKKPDSPAKKSPHDKKRKNGGDGKEQQERRPKMLKILFAEMNGPPAAAAAATPFSSSSSSSSSTVSSTSFAGGSGEEAMSA